jgi:hypothetical protein
VTCRDNFDRENSTALGSSWVEVAGNLDIVSQHLENAGVAGDHMAAVSGLPAADQTVSADFTSSGNNLAPSFGLVLRCQDCGTPGVPPANYYRIAREPRIEPAQDREDRRRSGDRAQDHVDQQPGGNSPFHLQGAPPGRPWLSRSARPRPR